LSAHAKPPSIPLDCGKASGAEAQRQYLDKASGGGDIYSILVLFTCQRPAPAKVEAVLRECIATALKLDGTKDVLATARLRKSPADTNKISISPFKGAQYISYTASQKTVAVHDIELNSKSK
jgi:hypothetical protein